jgi:hypothetical protein
MPIFWQHAQLHTHSWSRGIHGAQIGIGQVSQCTFNFFLPIVIAQSPTTRNSTIHLSEMHGKQASSYLPQKNPLNGGEQTSVGFNRFIRQSEHL